MPLYKAGQEIDAFCTKCKMDLLHRIVAEVRGKPVKVECRTCFTTHMYRPPKGAVSPGAVPAAAAGASSAAAGASSATSRRKAAAAVEEAPLVPPPGARIQQYKMTERFAPESWLMHKTFGTGQVVRDLGGDKIEVRFEGGNRVLVHGKTE